uniref:WH2 domain-containing protein n=1 Tax=Takifugu rubripes TaxID=31033 RepID=A0A674PDG4_TAKRU
MTSFGYHRELKMYEEEGDEDELLATLSSEELQELDRELIHLDDNIPIGMRQRVQTENNKLLEKWNPRQKNFKKSHDYKDSGDLLRDLRNVLKPSLQKRREEPNLPPPQRSSHDDLMAAIRASSIRSLKRVKFSESDLQDKRESITVVKPPSSHISRV